MSHPAENKILGYPAGGYTVDPKIDDLAVAVRYVDGRLTQVATRGDGRAGEDVTVQARRAVGLPQRLRETATLEVRGEVFVTDADFEHANALRTGHGGRVPWTPRRPCGGVDRRRHVRRIPGARFYMKACPTVITGVVRSVCNPPIRTLGRAIPSGNVRNEWRWRMFVKLAHFLNIMLYPLVGGVLWGTWFSLGRTMTQYDATTYLADGKHMIDNLAAIMPVLMIFTGLLGLVVVFLLFRHGSTAAAWLALISLLLVAVIAVTLSVEVPIDNKTKTWTPTTLPSDWTDIRARWAAFHTLRTFLSLAGLAAAVGAALTTRPATRAQFLPSGEQRPT
jgi:hypothetical protein